jgi:hypothetical protein
MLSERSNGFSQITIDQNGTARSASKRERRIRRRSGSSWARPLQGLVEDLPGWWLAALLVFAPWAYGTTFAETKDQLAVALCGLGVVFLISLFLRGRRPRISWTSVGLSLLTLGYGWWMTWNAKLVYDPQVFYFHPVSAPVPSLPGSVDQQTSWHQMLLITGLVSAFWVTSDLSAQDRWRRRFWLVISLVGVSVMILGLAQRLTSAPGIFWRSDLDCGRTFFATYRYHANAGTFINIVLPFVAAHSVCAFRKDGSSFGKAFWVLALLSVIVSALVNLSRAATVISVCLVVIFFAWKCYGMLRDRRRRGLSTVQIIVVLAIATGAGWLFVQEIGFGEAYKRWLQLGGTLSDNFRFIAYDVIEHRILPMTGWWGVGPNTFSLIFPFFTNSLGYRIWGYWSQAHQDYLQTLVEWGFCGTVLWFLLFANSIARACWAFLRRQRMWDGRSRALAFASLLALGSVLVHAMVDFPMQIASLQLYTSVVLGLVASVQYFDVKRVRRSKSSPVEEPFEQNLGNGALLDPEKRGVI